MKIDSNGSRPDVLKELVERRLVDYLAMDIKGPLKKYDSLTGVGNSGRKIRESIAIIMASGLPCEFRTTVVPSLLAERDFREIGKTRGERPRFVLQRYARTKQLDSAVPPPGAEPPDLEKCAEIMRQHVSQVRIR